MGALLLGRIVHPLSVPERGRAHELTADPVSDSMRYGRCPEGCAMARAERRLAAILAADVVGYSRLVECDEAGTLERLKSHRKELVEPLLAEHRAASSSSWATGSCVSSPPSSTRSPAFLSEARARH
jgi:class 3 adenylate cyclase